MPKISKPKKNPGSKIVLKIFDKKISGEKRLHNCAICQVYKREIAKGNKDAFEFYKQHINDWVKKYNGVTIAFDAQNMPAGALAEMNALE